MSATFTRITAPPGNSATAGSAPPSARLAWSTLVDAFEAACLLRCASAPALSPVMQYGQRPTHRAFTGPRPMVEFSQPSAAHRMRHLLAGLDIPVEEETVTAGLRRRYTVHRLGVPQAAQAEYAATIDLAWRQGRSALLSPVTAGTSTVRHLWRPRLAAAAWSAVLLAAGRHVRKHILGVRVTDQDLAGVLVRSAHLLGATASLDRRSGCFLVSVPAGADKRRIMQGTEFRSALASAS
ncbi:hypothetical protein GCM10027290_22080 [Micromonospora sonneratiae]|uniref:Uncharacterized protein n=1 Tax=Micromonospora sonneratiae TaxID=1184706 RepID=A0ABW3YH98_9ACTN